MFKYFCQQNFQNIVTWGVELQSRNTIFVCISMESLISDVLPYPHFDCNIPLKRQVPVTLWSTKQIEIKYLAQGHKHFGRSGARTHNIDGLVIMSPALFR